MAVVTDYDCWKETYEVVSAEMILDNLRRGTETVKRILKHTITRMPKARNCICSSALKNAIITSPELIPQQVKKDLAPIIGKYIK